jgi:uncharacterized protein (DUF305 family)
MRTWSAPVRRFSDAIGRRELAYRVAAPLVAILLIMTGYLLGASRSKADVPAEASVDVGFLRDMVVHHSQAVALAMIGDRRATVPAVRDMADEIATTQQREVGVMTGWLQQWGLSTSTTTPAMTWMTHAPVTAIDGDPPMPGMATRREVGRLAVSRGRSADLLFCRLMRSHHLGGLHMINEVIARGHQPEVVALATQMRTLQEREMTQLNRQLADLTRPTPTGH